MIPEVKLKFLIKEVKSVKISKMRVYAPAFMYLGACIGGCKEGVYLIWRGENLKTTFDGISELKKVKRILKSAIEKSKSWSRY